ncbi:MAG TPA: NERD domain-containing protein [Neobacillus sp.]
MIEKACAPNIRFQKLEALKRRLSSTHSQWPEVVTSYNSMKTGLDGERSLDFYLDLLPDSKYYIFHDLRLKYKNYFFQIDTLVLCTSFGLNLEVKKLTGGLFFDKNFNQLIVNKRNRRKNPVQQAKMQTQKLKLWLEEHNCPALPIHYLFVNSNEDAVIRTDPENEEITRNICNSEVLIDKIEQMEKYYSTEQLTEKELRKIRRLLLLNHTPDDPDILKEYHTSPKDIIPGAQCPQCKAIPMKYKSGTWHCPTCGYISKTAHIQAINDYFLLIKPSITNAELREFLHLPSRKISYHILNSMGFPFSGRNKGRVYFPSPPLKIKN